MSARAVVRATIDEQAKRKLESDPEGLHGAALQGFLWLAELWDLAPEERVRVLGLGDPSVLEAWCAHPKEIPGPEVLTRISHLFAIHRALTTLIPDQAQVKNWLRRPNGESRFQGRSPLSMLSSSHIEDLEMVHAVLNGMLNVW